MGDGVKEKLRELINTQGQQILQDPNKFTSLMLDLCLGTNEREIVILATALTKKIPQYLQSSGSTSLTDELSSSLSHRLENETGLRTDAANWAVNTWAAALGMVTGEYTRTKDTEKKGPPPELKDNVQNQPEVRHVESPVIGLDCTALDFGKVVSGTRPSKTIHVSNLGTGVLMGKVSTTEPWIEVYPQIIDVSGGGQTVAVTINSSLLLPEKHTTGYINIESNGGLAKIEIKVIASNKAKKGLEAWMIAAGIVGMLAIIGVAIQVCGNPAQEHLISGQSYSEQKQWGKAITEYNKAIELDPKLNTSELNTKLAEAYLNRGNAYYDKGVYDMAIADYSTAIDLDPKLNVYEQNTKLASAYYNRGIIYNNSGVYDKAIADYTSAIGLDPKLALAYRDRGTGYAYKNDFDKAISDYTKAIELDPKPVLAYIYRGYVYINKREYDKAIDDCARAIELNPKDALAYLARGTVYTYKNDFNKAISDYTKAIELDPKDAAAYSNRGSAYKNKGEYDRAEADFKKAKELGLR